MGSSLYCSRTKQQSRDSNPGQLGEKRERYHCARQPPRLVVPVGNVDVGVDDAGVEVALEEPVLVRAPSVSHLQVFQMSR